jgi:hypothetical protein
MCDAGQVGKPRRCACDGKQISLAGLGDRARREINGSETMNEAQAKQINDIVQEIAADDSISFDAAFKIAVGVLRLHAIESVPKGEFAAGGQASRQG